MGSLGTIELGDDPDQAAILTDMVVALESMTPETVKAIAVASRNAHQAAMDEPASLSHPAREAALAERDAAAAELATSVRQLLPRIIGANTRAHQHSPLATDDPQSN